MNEKIQTTEDVLGDFGFRLVWSVDDYRAEVVAYEICGRTLPGNEPLFQRHGAQSYPDNVEVINEAEECLSGFVKWDGCTELDMGCPHWCGPHDYKKHIALLEIIYRRAFELMKREPLDRWEES